MSIDYRTIDTPCDTCDLIYKSFSKYSESDIDPDVTKYVNAMKMLYGR
jgi:hypothetical protein